MRIGKAGTGVAKIKKVTQQGSAPDVELGQGEAKAQSRAEKETGNENLSPNQELQVGCPDEPKILPAKVPVCQFCRKNTSPWTRREHLAALRRAQRARSKRSHG